MTTKRPQNPHQSVPESLVDPITYEVFTDPVIASDGHTYERSSIEAWIQRCKEQRQEITSPLTRQPMTELLQDNLVVRQLLGELCQRCDSPNDEKEEGTKIDRRTPNRQSENPGDVASLTALTPIFHAVDPLRHVLESLDWQPPQIVVMGNENSGKSTIMERIAMMPLFPIDKRICTRMAVKVCLRRGEPQPPLLEMRDLANNLTLRSQHIAMDAAAARIDEWMREEVQRENNGATSGVCRSRMLVVHVQSSTAPNLDLVDLPGLVAAHVRGEPEDMREQTRQLVENYLDRFTQHSLILVTVPANTGPNQSIAMDIVQRRNLQEFTIGVLTKTDLQVYRSDDDEDTSDEASRLEELRSKLCQQSADVVPLHPHGYVATMNKQPKQRTGCRYDDLVAQAMKEREWFDAKGFADDDRTSVAALVARLTHMYHAYVRRTWLPGVMHAIQAEMAWLRQRDLQLGFPRAHDLDSVDPARLSATAKARFQHLLGESALEDICTAMHAEVLKNGQLFETATETQQIWTLHSWLRSLSECRVAEVEQAVARSVELCRDHIRTLLVSDVSGFRLARFARVIERVDVHAEKLLEDWRADVQATLVEVIQDYHRVDCSPHITLSHSIDRGARSATVCSQVDYSTLNVTVCQLVMEGICQCVLELCWDNAVPDGDDTRLWLESCADERAELLRKFDRASDVRHRLMALEQAIHGLPRHCNLERLQEATATGDVDEISNSAQLLVVHLKQLSSWHAFESLGDQGAAELVHAALERTIENGHIGNEALPPLLECIRWLCFPDCCVETTVNANVDRIRCLGTVQYVCASLSHDDARVVSAAMECLVKLCADMHLESSARECGVIDSTVRTLDKYLASPDVAEHGCRLIVQLVNHDACHAARLSEAGGCEAVTRALDQHAAVAEVVEWASKAITQLAARCPASRERLGRADACNALTRALEQLAPVGDVVQSACRAFVQLCGKCPENVARFGAAGACEATTQALQQHLFTAELATSICSTIGKLCTSDNENRARFGEAGACEALTRALQQHLSIAENTKQTCWAIVQLRIGNKKNAARFLAAGAKEVVNQAIQQHSGNVVALVWAQRAAKCL